MVKVLERSEEEKKNHERASKLEKIIKSLVPQAIIDKGLMPYMLSIGDKKSKQYRTMTMSVNLLDNKIIVYSPPYLNRAIKIAQAYEQSGEHEFIVKKDYASLTKSSRKV